MLFSPRSARIFSDRVREAVFPAGQVNPRFRGQDAAAIADAAGIAVPAGTRVNMTILGYDGCTPLRNPYWGKVTGTIGNQIKVNGKTLPTVRVDGARLYTLVTQKSASRGVLDLGFTPGLAAYAFTFG